MLTSPQMTHERAKLRMLHDVNRVILASRSYQELVTNALPYLKQLIPYEYADLVLFDFETGYATLLVIQGKEKAQLQADKHLPLTDFHKLPISQNNPQVVVIDLATTQDLSSTEKQLLAEGIKTYIMLPLVWQENLIGSFNLGVMKEDLLSLVDIETLQMMTDQIAMGVHHSLLSAADQRRLLESKTIIAISQALNETLDLEKVFQLIAESAWQIIPHAERTVIHLLDEQAQVLRPITVTRQGEVTHTGLMMRSGEGIAGHVILEGNLINVADTQKDSRFLASDRFLHRSLMVAPIKNQDERLGTISVQGMEPHAFTTDDERLLTILGTQAALAIKNAHLFAAEQQAHYIAETLRAANIALTQTLDLDKVLETLLEYIFRLIPYDSANVMLRQSDEQVIISASHGYETWLDSPHQLQGMVFPITWPTIRPIFAERKGVIIADTQTAPEWDQTIGAKYVRGWLGLPLLAGGEVIGLYSLDKAEPNFFTKNHQELAEAFAGQAAIAVHNALLYKAEREQFRRLQQSQAQLVQAEKMSALGRLVASIAHEINNPIHAMQGCLTLTTEELAEVHPDLNTTNLYLNIVKSELDRVATIVSNMRDFYRPAMVGMDLIDVHEIIESVLKLTGKQLQHGQITVVQEWGQSIPFVEANPSHLRQVFLNLVLNAIDAMPQGGDLYLSTTLSEITTYHREAETAVFIQVQDSGIGMSPETVSRLFEPFFTTKEQGSGLGLSISYGIIKAHNGDITVKSQAGKGTTFTLFLPVKQPDTADNLLADRL